MKYPKKCPLCFSKQVNPTIVSSKVYGDKTKKRAFFYAKVVMLDTYSHNSIQRKRNYFIKKNLNLLWIREVENLQVG